jgi:hypothetical protein
VPSAQYEPNVSGSANMPINQFEQKSHVRSSFR